MGQLNIRGVPDETMKLLKVRSAEAGVTLKEYVLGILEGCFPVKEAVGYKAVQATEESLQNAVKSRKRQLQDAVIGPNGGFIWGGMECPARCTCALCMGQRKRLGLSLKEKP